MPSAHNGLVPGSSPGGPTTYPFDIARNILHLSGRRKGFAYLRDDPHRLSEVQYFGLGAEMIGRESPIDPLCDRYRAMAQVLAHLLHRRPTGHKMHCGGMA